MTGLDNLPTPPRLFVMLENGTMNLEEFHRLMALHHQRAFQEIETARRDPFSTRFHNLVNKRAASRFVRIHGEYAIRRFFLALSELEDFPPAQFLWNARHLDVPIHCFFRTRETPVFRILRLDIAASRATGRIHHGEAKGPGAMVEDFAFRLSPRGQWELHHRHAVSGA
jgi:hypothetical protein